jgi:hypothetical protein
MCSQFQCFQLFLLLLGEGEYLNFQSKSKKSLQIFE